MTILRRESSVATDGGTLRPKAAVGPTSGRASDSAALLPVWTHVMRVLSPGGMSPARADAAAFEYLVRETDAPIARLAPGVFAFASTPAAPAPVERMARRLGADVFGGEASVVVEAIAPAASETAFDGGRELEPGRVVADMRAALAEAREVTRRLALDAGACVAAAGRSATALEIRCDDAVRRVMEAFDEGRRELRPQGGAVLDVARLERAAADLLEATTRRTAGESPPSAEAIADVVRHEIRTALRGLTPEIAGAVDEIKRAAGALSDATRRSGAEPMVKEMQSALRTLALVLTERIEADARDREATHALAQDVRSIVGRLDKLGAGAQDPRSG